MSNVKGVMSQVAEKDLDQSHDENLPVPSGTKGYHARIEEAGAQPVAKPGSSYAREVPEPGIYVTGPHLEEEARCPELKGAVDGGLAENRRLSPEAKGPEAKDKEARADTGANEGLKSAIYVKSKRKSNVPQVDPPGFGQSHAANLSVSIGTKGYQGRNEEAGAQTVAEPGFLCAKKAPSSRIFVYEERTWIWVFT